VASKQEAKIVFTGDAAGAVAATKRLNAELTALQKVSATAFGAGLGAGAAVATAALIATTKAAIDHGDALNDMSERTGMAVEELSKLEYIAKMNSVSTDSMAKGLTALSVSVAEAGSGVGPMAEKYAKLGISVRNADGTMKTSRQILGELADVFKAMPDGVEKTNLAVDIFGKRLGAEMIPMLNLGAAGMKKLGDEAEALGVVIGSAFAKESAEFNDNLDRMRSLAESAGVSFGNVLVPALNKFMAQLLDAKKAGLGTWEAILGLGTSNPFKTAKEQIADISKEIEKLRGKSALSGKLAEEFGNSAADDDKIAGLERLKKYYELQAERETGDGVTSAKEQAAKREKIERDLQAKLAEIAQLRAIAEGKVSADILSTDDKRVAAQIKNAQKLRDELAAAWKSALKDADEAGKAAAKLFDAAANTRQKTEDKATTKERSGMSEEDQQYLLQKDFREAADSAGSAATAAKFAAMYKRTESAAKLAAQAEKDAERATQFADKIADPTLGARAIREAGGITADVQETQGRIEQANQSEYEKQAAATATAMAQMDQQLTDLQTKAAALRVEADISAAQGQLAALQQQLDNMKNQVIPVTIQQINTGGAPLGGTDQGTPTSGGATGNFARGGYTGPGGKFQPAGIVHAGEFVLRQEVVRQRGALEFLARFNQVGLSALKGYASGGLVSGLRVPSIAPRSASSGSSGTPVNLYLDGARYPVTASSDVIGELKTAFRREALKNGGRR